MRLTIATRDSALALAQSREVAGMLGAAGHDCNILPLKTRGDIELDKPLHNMEGKGLFTKEIDRAVLDGRADIAVHSLKDMPVEDEDGLVLAAIPARMSDEDVLVGSYRSLVQIPAGSLIGCGSLRRRSQLTDCASHLCFAEVRGNIQTRLRKMQENGWAGLVMARAALQRLGLENEREFISLPIYPAAGQGALGIRARDNADGVLNALAGISCSESMARGLAEREFLGTLGGGCHTPAGLRSCVDNGKLFLEGGIFSLEGLPAAHGSVTGNMADAKNLGHELAVMLLRDKSV